MKLFHGETGDSAVHIYAFAGHIGEAIKLIQSEYEDNRFDLDVEGHDGFSGFRFSEDSVTEVVGKEKGIHQTFIINI